MEFFDGYVIISLSLDGYLLTTYLYYITHDPNLNDGH